MLGLNEGGSGGSVYADTDMNAANARSTVATYGTSVELRGSLNRACNLVVQNGAGGSVLCSAPNAGGPLPALGCSARTPWTCANLILGADFVNGSMADVALLVTSSALFVNTGDVASPAGWIRIDVGLEPAYSSSPQPVAQRNGTRWRTTPTRATCG